MKRILIMLVCMLTLTAVLLGTAGCESGEIKAPNLMDDFTPKDVSVMTPDEKFAESQMRLYLDLFKESVSEAASGKDAKNMNVLISPLSVELALAMTANGANGGTREEMNAVLAGEYFTIEELNGYLKAYTDSLPSNKKSKVSIANSIWFRDDENRIKVKEDFLQKNADYYGADVYKAPFDKQTVKDINNWIKNNTDDMIDGIVDEIDDSTVMYLINALAFEADWEDQYEKKDISDGVFTNIKGEKQDAEMMHASEYRFLNDGRATGFMKYYDGWDYCFAALLPNEEISVTEYINGLTPESIIHTINNVTSETVITELPKFSYDYSVSMKDILISLGMENAFDAGKADFTGIGTSGQGNIFINEVLHKTFISVDGLGTRAGAVTVVEAMSGGLEPEDPKIVKLDRPFVYMIIDTQTNLPIFMGVLSDLG